MDYGTVQKRRANFGVGIVEVNRRAGVVEQKYGVGLWCQNRPEWHLTGRKANWSAILKGVADGNLDLACMSQSLYTVSLYDTLGPSATEFIIQHASLPCVAASLPHIPTLLKLKSKLPTLKVIIALDPLDQGEPDGYSKQALLSALAEDINIRIYSIDQVEVIGASFGTPKYNPPAPSDIVTINYTSGTTGVPKGVVLSHAASVAGASTAVSSVSMTGQDVFMSYLPLAHVYERMMSHGVLWGGAAIGFFHGDILALVDDLKALRPTGFMSVPRLYNRFGGAIRAATTTQPGVKGALARHVVSTKLKALEPLDSSRATNRHRVYDRIWGRKVSAAFGLDRVTHMISGSAPLDPSLHQFLRVVFGNFLMQGYGLTETYAVGLCQTREDFSAGNCGGVCPANELCLSSVPEMEYLVTDQPQPRGELLIRGNTLFSGYLKNEEETKKAILPDGWFRTGDICTIDPKGRFQIIDRVKNILKLAQGEYVSPERIENVYLSHLNFLSQGFVHGDSIQTFLVGIFGIMPEPFAEFASKVLGRKIRMDDTEALLKACQDQRVRLAVLQELERVGRKNDFAGFERVRNCYLYMDPFSIENELLTPT